MSQSLDALKEAVANIADETVLDLVKECLKDGLSPVEILEEGLSKGLDVVGQKFEEGEYFLADLILAGDVVTESSNFLKSKMDQSDMGKKGKVLLATVKGDIHDIGKDIVAMLLSASGFEVIDLGVDVPSEKIIETVSTTGVNFLGLSVLLTTMTHNLNEIVEGLTRFGIRDRVKIAIGGACCSQKLADATGVDAYGESAVSAVEIFERFYQNKD